MTNSDFLTVTDIAFELKLTERTVRKLITSGTLPCKKIAGKYVITRQKLLDFIEN